MKYTGHLRQNYTSVYSFGYEFRQGRNIASDGTSGIRAASEYPQRIISDMDVGGSRQERVRSANSSLSSCTGMYNCLTVYFKRLTESYILRAATGNPQRIISDMDVGGFRQERVRTANSSLSSCTGMYNCLTVYFKRLTENVFSKAVGVCAAH